MDESRKPVSNQSPPRKKPKNNPDTNKISDENNISLLTMAIIDNLIMGSHTLKGTLEYMPTSDKPGFFEFLFNQNELSNQFVVTQQRKRYYWQQILLYIFEEKRLQQQPIKNDGSLINQLDDDCLAKIFKYLPIEERLKMEEVCQQWKRALEYAWSDVKRLDYNFIDRMDQLSSKKDSEYQVSMRNLGLVPKLICQCGLYLKELDVTALPFSKIMSIIKLMCINLIKLQVLFQEVIDEDLEDAFNFMPNLKSLNVTWDRKTIISESFIKSLNALTDTLEELKIIGIKFDAENKKENNDFPDSLISTFCRFESLQSLFIAGYNLNDKIIKAISQKENLIKLELYGNTSDWGATYAQNIYPISNLRKLEYLKIVLLNVTDNFLINLADNSKNLKYLKIDFSNMSDAGILSLTKLEKLEEFLMNIVGNAHGITDESVRKFKNMKKLSFQNSREVTNDAIINILENCPNLEELNICHTGVTIDIIEEATRITKNRKNNIILKMIVYFKIIPNLSEDTKDSSPWLQVQNAYDDDDDDDDDDDYDYADYEDYDVYDYDNDDNGNGGYDDDNNE